MNEKQFIRKIDSVCANLDWYLADLSVAQTIYERAWLLCRINEYLCDIMYKTGLCNGPDSCDDRQGFDEEINRIFEI